MGARRAFGARWRRLMGLWFGVVLAALMVSGLSVPAEAETVTATPAGTFMRLSVGDFFGCALTPAGVAGCWGMDWGEATAPAMRPGPYREISAGGDTWCGLRDNDTIECWGDPVGKSPSPLRGKFRSVSVGGDLVCGIQLNWDLACAQFEESAGRPSTDPCCRAVQFGERRRGRLRRQRHPGCGVLEQ